MCLYKTHRLPKISRKPIQCYKVFNVSSNGLITPWRKYFCNVGDTIKAKNHWLIGIFKRELEKEVVHAFRNDYDAEWYCSEKPCVCLCEIPPSTPYWLGECGEIGASKMKIIKRL